MKVFFFCLGILLASCNKETIQPKAVEVDTVRLDTIPHIER